MKYRISRVVEILRHLHVCIEKKTPFSLIRFGDGGLKMMNSVNFNRQKNVAIIADKEGIPISEMDRIIQLWAKYANEADYIDTPAVYDKEYFWGRYKKGYNPINSRTQALLDRWENVYNDAGIITKRRQYCNPEFNWLSILDLPVNLIDIMKNKKICFISVFSDIPCLSEKFDIDFIQVVGHYENQFQNSFGMVIEYIKANANKYDLWLNSSGELGRVYSGVIKENGGRVLDMGFVAQFWDSQQRPERFKKFMMPHMEDNLKMELTDSGLKYRRNI